MVESQQVLEWIAEGEVKGELKGKAEALLSILAKQFPPGPSTELAAVIRSSKDSNQLSRWVGAALEAKSLAEFSKAVESESRNGA